MGRKPTTPRVEYRGAKFIVLHESGAIPYIEGAGLDVGTVRQLMQKLGDEMKRAALVFKDETRRPLYFVAGARTGFLWCVSDDMMNQRVQSWLRTKAKKMDGEIVSILKNTISSNSSSPKSEGKT